MPSRTPQGKGENQVLFQARQCFLARVVHVGYSTLKFTDCQIVVEGGFQEVVYDVECCHDDDFVRADDAAAFFNRITFFVQHFNGLQEGGFFFHSAC